MLLSRTITDEAEDVVFYLFRDKLPPHCVFHNFPHTRDVVRNARKIAKALEVSDDALEIVTLAGWFHDTGYTETYTGHEESSIRIAREFLTSRSYPDEKIELVVGCIAATKVPQKPKNLLEEIVCDADLSSLGKENFLERSKLLRIEKELTQQIVITDMEWLRNDLHFLTGHNFHTKYAQVAFNKQKSENILRLNELLTSIINTADQTDTSQPKTVVINNETTKHIRHDDDRSSIGIRAQRLMIAASVFVVVILLSFLMSIEKKAGLWHYLAAGAMIVGSIMTLLYSYLASRPRTEASDDEDNNAVYLKWGTASFFITVILYAVGYFLIILTRHLSQLPDGY